MEQQKGTINRNRVFAFGVLIALVIILILLLWWWFRPQSVAPQPTQPQTQGKVVLPATAAVDLGTQGTQITTPSNGELEVMSLARTFAERYGSWSTDSNFQNLRDVTPLVTDALRATFEATIAKGADTTVFKGTETKAINVTIKSLTAAAANVDVQTQRVETDEALKRVVSYHVLSLKLIKKGQYWLVDTATWQS